MENEEQILFFQEMLLGCYKLWSWLLDAQLNTIQTNSPYPNLHSQLLLGKGRWEALLAHIREDDRPMIISDDIGLMWAMVYKKEPCGDMPQVLHVLGPIFTGDISNQSLERLLASYNLSIKNKCGLVNCLMDIPVISTVVFFQQIIMMYYYAVGKKIQISDFVYYNPGRESVLRLQEKNGDKREVPHSPLVNEKMLLDMVRTGNLEYHSALAAAGSASPGIRTKSNDPIRQAKYSVVAFITLCTRAAIEGGLSSECAYTLSDTYTESVDNCTTISQIAACSHTMYDDFIRRVNQCRRESDVSRPVRICCDYIDTHPTEELELEQLARRVGYTEYYLTRKFKREMNMTINAYIRAARLRQAKIFLTESRLSVQEISELLHFCSRSYFADVFQKSEGISPNDYRARGKNVRRNQNMYLNENADLTAFLEAVRTCAGAVQFQTEDGDSLNLKSFLCRYLFNMIATNQNYILTGRVVCSKEEDYQILSPFLHEQ